MGEIAGMIIDIIQTAGIFKQTYEVCGKGFGFSVNVGRFHRYQNILMTNPCDRIEGEWQFSRWYHYIPFRWLFGKANVKNRFRIRQNESPVGTVQYSHHGFLKSRYEMLLDDGTVVYGYAYSWGKFDYLSIYAGDEQIALLETYMVSENDCFRHKLYLMETHENLAQLLSFFSVYYVAGKFVTRNNGYFGTGVQYAWSFSRYRRMYDPAWRERNFPNDDFWGKINRFD